MGTTEAIAELAERYGFDLILAAHSALWAEVTRRWLWPLIQWPRLGFPRAIHAWLAFIVSVPCSALIAVAITRQPIVHEVVAGLVGVGLAMANHNAIRDRQGIGEGAARRHDGDPVLSAGQPQRVRPPRPQ